MNWKDTTLASLRRTAGGIWISGTVDQAGLCCCLAHAPKVRHFVKLAVDVPRGRKRRRKLCDALPASRTSSRLPQSTGWGARSVPKEPDSRAPRPLLSGKHLRASLPRRPRRPPVSLNPYDRTDTAPSPAWLTALSLPQPNPSDTPGQERLLRDPRARAAPRISDFSVALPTGPESACEISTRCADRRALLQTRRLRPPRVVREAPPSTPPAV